VTTTEYRPTADEKAIALAARQAESLRALADMIEANPQLAEEISYGLGNSISVPIVDGDQKAKLAAFAKATTKAGAKVTKHATGGGNYFGIKATLGEVTLDVWASRDQVCERIVTGTKEVTEEVLDPEALAAVPRVAVTKTVEEVEWRCTSLLAAGAE